MPRVSVIAMTLNHERYADQALRALERQTYRDLELIITDDGSQDATRSVIEAWMTRTGRRPTLVYHEERRGICATLNHALRYASGQFVAVASLDDEWLPQRIEQHVEAFDEADPRVAVVYSDLRTMNDAGEITDESYLRRWCGIGAPEGRPPPTGDVFEDLIRGNFIATPGATMRRSSLDAVGPYDERLSVEDWDMWLRLAARYPFSYSEPAVGTYRIHDGGYWRQLVREQTARQPLFFSLIKAYGVRDGTDPVIMARLEELVGDMVADGDPKAADFERWLAEIRTTYERDQLERQTRAPVNRSDDRESEQQVGPGPAVAGWDPAEMHRAARQIAAGSSVGRARGTEGVLQPSPSGILYIAPWMTTGGSDQATLEWFRHIDHSTFRRYLVTTLASDNALFDACASVADEAWCLPELIRREAVPQFLVDFIAGRGIDVIHIMNSKFGVDLIPAIKAAYPDVPIVVQFHMDDADLSGTGYPRYVASRYDAQVDAYSVISQDMANRLRAHGVTPGKIEVIYLGVDATGRFDPNRSDGVAVDLAPGRFHVLVPARLVEVKRPELAIDIAEKLAHRVPEAQCHFVGDGPLRQSLERTCSERNLGDLVRFHGASTNMWGWYTSCQASLLCSISEGIPMVLYESMSMGLPMVAPLLGGISELLDEDTGAPLPVGAGIDAYVDALVTLAEDPDRRMRLGAEARRRVLEGFKVENMGDRHRELYGRLIAGARVPS